MPQAAKKLTPEKIVPAVPEAVDAWSGAMHGVVGDMHRVLEERLLAGPNTMAVVTLPIRPAEALTMSISRVAGWSILGGCFATAGFLLLHLA